MNNFKKEKILEVENKSGYEKGFNECGLQIILLMEKYWDALPQSFINDVYKLFKNK